MALNAIAANPKTPSTPLRTRINGEILFCFLSVYNLGDEGLHWVSSGQSTSDRLVGSPRPEAVSLGATDSKLHHVVRFQRPA